jgi:hypothetical protein
LTDTISLRKVRPIIVTAAQEAESPDAASPLDSSIMALIRDPEMTIDEAYEDTVEVIIEFDKLERRTRNILRSFERLLTKARSDEEQDAVRQMAQDFAEQIRSL